MTNPTHTLRDFWDFGMMPDPNPLIFEWWREHPEVHLYPDHTCRVCGKEIPPGPWMIGMRFCPNHTKVDQTVASAN